jgi:hypothetical protein
VDAHASLKHFTTAIRWLVARMTDAETKLESFCFFSNQPEKSLRSKRNRIAALVRISQLGFTLLYHP